VGRPASCTSDRCRGVFQSNASRDSTVEPHDRAGQSPDGGWPFVKLLNFGLAGLDELHSDSAEASELAPTISPQFASPEQRANGEIDFRSEMYSLGATMCFLLTGAAPMAVAQNESAFADLCSALGARRSSGKRFNLLVYLLRENPENRPQDPVALEKQMRDCLTKIDRRQPSVASWDFRWQLCEEIETAEATSNTARSVLRGFAAVAVLVLAAAAAAEYFFPDKIPYFRRSEQIGVPVGVPDAPNSQRRQAKRPLRHRLRRISLRKIRRRRLPQRTKVRRASLSKISHRTRPAQTRLQVRPRFGSKSLPPQKHRNRVAGVRTKRAAIVVRAGKFRPIFSDRIKPVDCAQQKESGRLKSKIDIANSARCSRLALRRQLRRGPITRVDTTPE